MMLLITELMLHLKVHYNVHFIERLKIHKKVAKMMYLKLHWIVHTKLQLSVQVTLTEGTPEDSPKTAIQDLYEHAEEGGRLNLNVDLTF